MFRVKTLKEVNIKIELQGVNEIVNLNCYDLPGKDVYIALNRIYIRDANVALIVFDKTKRKSLDQAEKWIEELQTLCQQYLAD